MTQTAEQTQSDLLMKAFTSFTEASTALQESYLDLQGRARRLSDQLEETTYYLSSVLQSLPCGVLVVAPDFQVTTMNPKARELFSLHDGRLPMGLGEVLKDASFSDRATRLNGSPHRETEIQLSNSQKILHCSWSSMRNGERVLLVQDVTEVRNLESEMQRTQRAAAMGEMALELAHEIMRMQV